MRTVTITIRWLCPECGNATSVKVWPIVPAKLFGPPEDCFPEEGGEIDPQACEHCGHSIDVGAALEQASDAQAEAQQARDAARLEAWKERNL